MYKTRRPDKGLITAREHITQLVVAWTPGNDCALGYHRGAKIRSVRINGVIARIMPGLAADPCQLRAAGQRDACTTPGVGRRGKRQKHEQQQKRRYAFHIMPP